MNPLLECGGLPPLSLNRYEDSRSKLPHSTFALIGLLLSAGTSVRAQPPVSYRKQIAPLFASSCNACHGGASPQSGLALTTYAALLKGGRRGKPVVPGNPTASLLV